MSKGRVGSTGLGPHVIEITREDMRLECQLGEAIYDEHRIRLDDSLVGSDLKEIFVHEGLHLAARASRKNSEWAAGLKG